MAFFLLRRIATMLLTALCLTFIVFWLTNLAPNLEKLAKNQGNVRMTDEQVASFLQDRGYAQPLPLKYAQWLGVAPGWVIEGRDGTTRSRCNGALENGVLPEDARSFCGVLQGDWGYSTVFQDGVGSIIATRLGLTGKLMFWVMMVMVPGALIIGVLAGMREGSRLDRSLSTVSILSTATPEYVSGVVFITVFVVVVVFVQGALLATGAPLDGKLRVLAGHGAHRAVHSLLGWGQLHAVVGGPLVGIMHWRHDLLVGLWVEHVRHCVVSAAAGAGWRAVLCKRVEQAQACTSSCLCTWMRCCGCCALHS